MLKVGLGVIVGGILILLLCLGCCCLSLVFMSGTPEFREGYCESYLEEAGTFKSEPFGWCR